MILRDIAHARSGDKGNLLNISVIAFDAGNFELLRREVSIERVRACLGEAVRGAIERYEMPELGALNFVLHEASAASVTPSLAQDVQDNGLSSVLLGMEIGGPDSKNGV